MGRASLFLVISSYALLPNYRGCTLLKWRPSFSFKYLQDANSIIEMVRLSEIDNTHLYT